MKKFFTILAFTTLSIGSAFAGTITIGDQTYDKLQDAVSAVEDGQTIYISGTVSCSARAGKDKVSYSIVGTDNAVISGQTRGELVF